MMPSLHLTQSLSGIRQNDFNCETTPSAYLMKGMALKKQKKNTEAKASFTAVVKQYPTSQEAPQAEVSNCRSLGAVPTAAAPTRKPATH